MPQSCAVRFAAPLPLGLLLIGSAIGCRSRAERPAADKATTGAPVVADPLGRDEDAGELYFGVSRQRIAWLVYLNRQTRSGVLYEPLGTVSLCDVHLGPGDTLSFQSAVVTGAYYGFTGILSEGRLDGVISVIRKRSRTPPDSFRVMLARTPLPEREGSTTMTGVYSDVWYHEGAGDLLGQEVLLFETPKGPEAVTILYGGGPDWPRGADSITRSGDTLAIWQKEPFHRGPPPDRAVLRGDTLSFFDEGPQLPRKHSLRSLFTGPPNFRCQ